MTYVEETMHDPFPLASLMRSSFQASFFVFFPSPAKKEVDALRAVGLLSHKPLASPMRR